MLMRILILLPKTAASMSNKDLFLDGAEMPPIPLPLLFSDNYCRTLSGNDYRRLHCDWRTSKNKFSQQMERAVKMPLRPGRGLMDWIRLSQTNPNMSGVNGGPLRVTDKDMAERGDNENAWTIINGNVYNITPYMEYHPGGIDQLMRVAGTDGTKLFNEKHPWVNYESMLKACFVGQFVGSYSKLKPAKEEVLSISRLSLNTGTAASSSSNLLSLPGQIQYPKGLIDYGIKAAWKEDQDSVQMVVDTAWKALTIESVVVECINGRKLRVLFDNISPCLGIIWNLPYDIDPGSLKANTSHNAPGRLLISFQKQDIAIVWPEFLHRCEIIEQGARRYRSCQIQEIAPVTHDTRLFTVYLPDGDSLPVPIGSHVFLRLSDNDERPYTPVTQLGLPPNGCSSSVIYFLIKVYSDGRFTPKLWLLQDGDSLEMSDHRGSFNTGKFEDSTHLVMLAAGTGFTPMVRIIQHCLYKENKKVTLLFFNKKERDILWRTELDQLGEQFNQFHVINILSDADDSWQGRKGRVSIELLSEFLLPTSESNFICVCGPNGFVESSLICLRQLNYEDVYVFQG